GAAAHARAHHERDAGAAGGGAQHASGAECCVARGGGRVEDLFERLTARLAGLGLHGVEQHLAACEEQVVPLQQHGATVGVARGPPGALGFAGTASGVLHVGDGCLRQLVEHLAGEGGDHGDGGGGTTGEIGG